MGSLDIIAVPAHHWSGRGLGDRNATHWAGWVLRSAGISAYYAGRRCLFAGLHTVLERSNWLTTPANRQSSPRKL